MSSPTVSGSRRTKPGRGQLDRSALVGAALEIADADGLDAVTIRRVAEHFGVTAMALYWHFASKDELLDAMGDHVLDSVLLPAAGENGSGSDWAQQLRDILAALVEAFRAHPNVVELAAGRILTCEPGRELSERTLGFLRGAGFDVDQAAAIAHRTLSTAIMLVTTEPGAESDITALEREARRSAKSAAIAALPADRFPNLRAAAVALTHCADEQTYYGDGIDLFIAGMRGLYAGRAPAPR